MKWKLPKLLEELGINAHALARESKVSYQSIWPMTKEAPAMIRLETLSKIIGALRELSGRDITESDIFEYETNTKGTAVQAERKTA